MIGRSKLIWFALGVFAACGTYLLSNVLSTGLVLDDSEVAYLIITEPEREVAQGDDVPDEFFIADRTGELLRRCGARGFETTFVHLDSSPTAELPLIAENNHALECVMNAVIKENLAFRIETRWSSSVANEMRTEQ